MNDTADLTEIISPVLDTIKPDPFPEQYFLEITSPGLERPLKTKDAVAGAVGKYIHVGLYQAIDKQKVFEGTLVSFEEDELTMEYMDKTRKKTVQIPYSLVVCMVHSARMVRVRIMMWTLMAIFVSMSMTPTRRGIAPA